MVAGNDVTLDVTSSQSVADAAAMVRLVGVLVNGSGVIGPNGPFQEVTDEAWDATLSVNLSGVFRMCSGFAPGMAERGWGRIVNMASMAGKDATSGMIAYSASKACVI